MKNYFKGMGFLGVLISGCETIGVKEYAEFEPQSRSERVTNNVNVTWEVRPDAADFCSKVLKQKGEFMAMHPLGCSIWVPKSNLCKIFTNPNPNHVVLGHELRHCFEGHFHP